MSVPKLYFNIICPPCRSVYLLARMLDIQLEYQEVNIMTKNYLNELRKVNIRHTIPVLDDNGFMLTDSHAIAPYLVLKYSTNQSMYPKDLQKRALIDQFLHYDSGVLYPLLFQTISPILFRNQFALTMSTVSRIKENYAQMNAHIKDHRWLMGDVLTIADLTCLCTTSTLDMLYPVSTKYYPNLSGYLERFKQVPHYNECNLMGLSKLAQLIQDKINSYNIATAQAKKSIKDMVDLE